MRSLLHFALQDQITELTVQVSIFIGLHLVQPQWKYIPESISIKNLHSYI